MEFGPDRQRERLHRPHGEALARYRARLPVLPIPWKPDGLGEHKIWYLEESSTYPSTEIPLDFVPTYCFPECQEACKWSGRGDLNSGPPEPHSARSEPRGHIAAVFPLRKQGDPERAGWDRTKRFYHEQ